MPLRCSFIHSMNSKPTLTIGIAAYNEAANIGHLLHALLRQHADTINLERIVVISDGSNDATAARVQEVADSRIIFFDDGLRLGKSVRENEILTHATSDFLLILDADVLPRGEHFLDALIAPLLRDKSIGLVAATLETPPARNAFEHMLNASHVFKQRLVGTLRGGCNLYLCRGTAYAFARQFYESLHWEVQSPEDAFAYFSCLKAGFRFEPVADAVVLFRQPNNFRDYRRQAARFRAGVKRLQPFFDDALVSREYHIPLSHLIKHLLLFTWEHPLLAPWYIAANLSVYILGTPPDAAAPGWAIAESSKQIL